MTAEWSNQFQLIVPDQRGHGRSSILSKPFRHEDAAVDVLALVDQLGIGACSGLGISGGGNVLLHTATRQPERIAATVLVSATPYFPAQARAIMRQYSESLPEAQWEALRRRHPGGDSQISALLASTKAFAERYDEMNSRRPISQPSVHVPSLCKAIATLCIRLSSRSKWRRLFRRQACGSCPKTVMAP